MGCKLKYMSLPLVDIIMINEELELSPNISGVQRYLNLWFLLCPSLLRPFNLIRNEIVWQICCSLLLLTVPMDFIFSSPSPSPLPPPDALSGQTRNTEAITWKYRCPTIKSLSHRVCLQWAPQAGGHAPPSVLRTDPDKSPPTEDAEESHSLSLCQEILQYLLPLQLGSM